MHLKKTEKSKKMSKELKSHAYLFEGNNSNSLLEYAKSFADKITSHKSEFLIVTNKICDSKNLDKNLSVDAVRAVINQSSLMPDFGYTRVVVFPFADTMTIQAQNALLKILEEPSDQTVFILLSKNPRKILPTIQSRVVKLKIKESEPEIENNLGPKLSRQLIEYLETLSKSTDFLDFYKFIEFLKTNKKNIDEILENLKSIIEDKLKNKEENINYDFWCSIVYLLQELEYRLNYNNIYNICISEFVIQIWETIKK